jgi:ABC-type uncharacterized transport system
MSEAVVRFFSLAEVWLGALGLAAFLAIFWVLRGAPVGQAVQREDDEDAPRVGYRDRIVAAMTVGLLLIGLGAYLAVTRGPAWSIPAFVLGFGTVFSLVQINQRYRHGSPTLRRTVDVSTTALNASLFAGILIVFNVIAFRYGGQALDLTNERAFSLSSQTLNQLATLKRPVTFTTFFGRSRAALQELDRVNSLLELYKAANPKQVRLDAIDPFRDLARYEALIKRVPLVDVTPGGGVVVDYGEGETAETQVVRNVDLFELPAAARFDPNAERFESVFKGEDGITSALIRLREGKRPKVVFTTGHGEPAIDDMDTNRPALGVWRSRLATTGSDVVAVNLMVAELPADTAIVIVAGPKSAFKPEEAAKLKTYSDRKGPVLLVLDATEATGLEEFLRGFQIEFDKGFILEPQMNVRRNPTAVLVPIVNPQHPILESLNNQPVVFRRPSPLKLATPAPPPAPAPPSGTMATPLLRTSPQSWVETNRALPQLQRGPNNPAGPFNVGMVATDRPERGDTRSPTPRLVVFSGRYIGDNADVQFLPANLDLLMNSVNWLRGKEESLGITPKTHVARTLTANPLVRARLVLVPTVMAVLLILSLGVVTYLARRE